MFDRSSDGDIFKPIRFLHSLSRSSTYYLKIKKRPKVLQPFALSGDKTLGCVTKTQLWLSTVTREKLFWAILPAMFENDVFTLLKDKIVKTN